MLRQRVESSATRQHRSSCPRTAGNAVKGTEAATTSESWSSHHIIASHRISSHPRLDSSQRLRKVTRGALSPAARRWTLPARRASSQTRLMIAVCALHQPARACVHTRSHGATIRYEGQVRRQKRRLRDDDRPCKARVARSRLAKSRPSCRQQLRERSRKEPVPAERSKTTPTRRGRRGIKNGRGQHCDRR